jgi:hypothetical protein
MCDLIISIVGTVIGGLLLTIILFFVNEYVFPKINLTGEWETTVMITKSSHNPFINLTMDYKIHLIQKGYELIGSGEKIKEILPNGEVTEFLREKRVLIDVEGFYERKYFKKSKIYFNICEEGRKRETRSTYFLVLKKHNCLVGTFISTAADASGIIKMKKS